MIPLTPLFSRYKDSYLLYSFRLIDLLRASKSTHLTKILSSQATYLYHFACLMKYKDIQKYEVQQLIEWAMSVSPQIDLQQFRIEFIDKTNELNLRSCQPKSFMYTFTTIWDTIHFISLIIDDMVQTRDKSSLDFVMQQLKTMKVLYYNMFFILQCAICRDHYMNVKGYIIYHIECVEIALDKEKFGTPIVFVDEYQHDSSVTGTNVLMKNLMAYVSMIFHNHINDYKWLQRNKAPPSHYERMTWAEYKKLLSI
ncbi:P33 [Lonomia obliqua multiple nucleopolyhedrovirus]|uniref:p33 n=1 Tax=Lonomia obliqua multiple nucleopolyhedrovirus TaxID=134394 RepID=A0A126FC46_9ABAC|nr:P33 [Lonomia obliqua multiple nucleopolyhedrovirus]AKN80971.1 P33 [Lonomia obliqua multiple nucleopolyhedrovirus]